MANNVMRQVHRRLTSDEEALIKKIKDLGEEFYDLCTDIGATRELSIAKGKIEEAVMWAVKSVTR